MLCSNYKMLTTYIPAYYYIISMDCADGVSILKCEAFHPRLFGISFSD